MTSDQEVETGRRVGFEISDREFELLRDLVYQESGISLSKSKKSLVISRLSKQLRGLGLDTFHAYYDYIVQDSSREEFIRMLDLISTNKTDFFREPVHFEFMKSKVLPKLGARKKIRIWSSACSSGEEPYTIAMTLMDGLSTPRNWDVKILASDLSTQVLEKASTGVYDSDRVEDLAPDRIRRHFLKGRGSDTGKLKVKPYLREMVMYRRINLMDDRFPIKSPLDIIFCRNVMIYFDKKTQEKLVGKFYRYLKPGGYLFIGHSESLQWLNHQYKHIQSTVYQKEGDLS